jgi:hypothetical protein
MKKVGGTYHASYCPYPYVLCGNRSFIVHTCGCIDICLMHFSNNILQVKRSWSLHWKDKSLKIYESKKTKESKREKAKICCGHLCQREIIVSFNKLHYYNKNRSTKINLVGKKVVLICLTNKRRCHGYAHKSHIFPWVTFLYKFYCTIKNIIEYSIEDNHYNLMLRLEDRDL